MIDIPTFVLALFATASVASAVGFAVGILWASCGWKGLFDRLVSYLERRRAEEEGDWWKE